MAARQVSMKDLPALAGTELGVSAPLPIPQARIDMFAEATEDRQWIHTDPVRAAGTPFGGTIAHGFLTLSLGSVLLWDLIDVPDAEQVINYGLDKVRFTAPVPAGSEIEMAARIESVTECRGGYQLAIECTYRVPGAERPACISTMIFRYLGEV